MPTREAILGKLKSERDRLIERYRNLTLLELETDVTESESEEGSFWSPKDHLAHLCHIEGAFRQMVRDTLDGKENPTKLTSDGSEKRDRSSVIARVHRRNEKQVNLRRGEDLASLFVDLEAARNETIALVQSLTDEQLANRVPGAPWGDGSIGGVLITNGYHEAQHLAWVEEGLAKSSLREK